MLLYVSKIKIEKEINKLLNSIYIKIIYSHIEKVIRDIFINIPNYFFIKIYFLILNISVYILNI
jgi:hypothetical protein